MEGVGGGGGGEGWTHSNIFCVSVKNGYFTYCSLMKTSNFVVTTKWLYCMEALWL